MVLIFLIDIFGMNMERDQQKQMPVVKQEDQSSLIPVKKEGSNNFLEYLDSHFVPEIDLKDDPKQEIKNAKISLAMDSEPKEKGKLGSNVSTKDSFIESSEVNLKYKGQKNSFSKGTYAERVDVVYKTLLRSIRRYLWEIFTQEHNPKEIKDRAKSSQTFKGMLTEFSSRYFQSALQQVSESEDSEQLFLENLASFMTNKFWIPDNSFRIRKFRGLITANLKQYSAHKYCQLFNLEGCVEFFKVLETSGFAARIIDAYPKLAESRDSYLKVVSDIINIS